MFDSAEIGAKVPPEEYELAVLPLRGELLAAQRELLAADFSVLVLLHGDDFASVGEAAMLLHEWMDSRHIETHAHDRPSDEELERPPFWRYWRTLPPKGRMAVFFGSWYREPILRAIDRRKIGARLDGSVARIVALERELADNGVLVVKFWFHTTKKTLARRLKEVKDRPENRWRAVEEERRILARYDFGAKVARHVLERTSAGSGPWHVVESTDARFRNLAVGRKLLDAIRLRLEIERERRAAREADRELARELPEPGRAAEIAPDSPVPSPPASADRAGGSVLASLDLARGLDRATYDEELAKWQGKLAKLHRAAMDAKRSSVLVFEGWDAAGKGSMIRRFLPALDPRRFRVNPVAAPTDEERAHPYMWRFWRRLPRAGRVAIFDRSWYGRVLVERVEGFASVEEWTRAYGEIVEFERALVEHGIVLAKFWLHIGKDEQLRRFEARRDTPHKRHKITDEDWRNRAKWDEYEAAIEDAFARTSTTRAPWTPIEAEDKRYARVKALRVFCERLEGALG